MLVDRIFSERARLASRPDDVFKMAAGKTDGPALTDSEDEQPIKDTTDCTPLRGKRQTEECGRSKTFGYFDAALVLISLVAYLVDSLTGKFYTTDSTVNTHSHLNPYQLAVTPR